MTRHINKVLAFLINKALALVIVVSAVTFAITGVAPPDVAPADGDPARFSAERAMEYVRALSEEPRPTGSDRHEQMMRYVGARLAKPYMKPGSLSKLEFNVVNGPSGATIVGGYMENIVVTRKGTDSTGAILLVAHYDSQINTPGAGDNAAGVATLLETVRALEHGPALRNDVIFLFTDAEEAGLLGARAFMRQYPEAEKVAIALNFEGRGNRGPSLLFETSPGNHWLIEQLAEAVDYPVAGSMFYEVYRRLPNDTDFTVFKRNSIPGYNFAFMGGLEHYHAASDTADRLDPRSLQHHGDYAVSLTRHLGQLDLAAMPAQSERRDAVYFNSFGGHLVHYPAGWSAALAIAVLAAWAALWWRLWRTEGLRPRAIAQAALAFPVTAAMACAAAVLVMKALAWLHPEWEHFMLGGVHGAHAVFAAVAAATWAVFAGAYAVTCRRLGGIEAALGAHAWLLALLVAMLILAPTASYLVLFPLSFVVAGLLVETWLSQRAELTPVLRAVFAIPAVAILCPPLALSFEAMGINTVAPQAAFIVLLGAMLIPWLDAIARLRAGLPAASALAALGLFVVAGFLAPDYDRERPLQSHIAYYADRDTRRAAWIAPIARSDPFTRKFFDGSRGGVAARPGGDGAGAAAEGSAGAGAIELPPTLAAARVVPAQYQATKVPTLKPLTPWTEEAEGHRFVVLLITPPETFAVDVLIPRSVGLRRLRIGRRDLPGRQLLHQPGGDYHVIHLAATNRWNTGLELTVAERKPISIVVVGRQPGLPEWAEQHELPPELIPAASTSGYWSYATYTRQTYHFEPIEPGAMTPAPGDDDSDDSDNDDDDE